MGKCLAGNELYRPRIVYHHEHFSLAKQVAFFKALGRHLSLAREKEVVPQKAKNVLLTPQGFRPEGELPRRHPSNSRVY